MSWTKLKSSPLLNLLTKVAEVESLYMELQLKKKLLQAKMVGRMLQDGKEPRKN